MRRLVLIPILILAIFWANYGFQSLQYPLEERNMVPALETETDPSDKKEIEGLMKDFITRYYTFSYDNYYVEAQKLIPYLTSDYINSYNKQIEKSNQIIQTVKVVSNLSNLQIIAIEKASDDKDKVSFLFTAQVTNQGQDTESTYNNSIYVRKVNEKWLIDQIETEKLAEFIKLPALL